MVAKRKLVARRAIPSHAQAGRRTSHEDSRFIAAERGSMETLVFRATAVAAPRHRLPLAVVLALLLSGCGTIKAYDGPELPQSEISVLDRLHSHSWMLAFFGLFPVPATFRHETVVLEVDGHKGRGAYPYQIRNDIISTYPSIA